MDSTFTGRTVNKMLLLNSWQIGSGTPTDFTQSLQNPIVNARAVHFLGFVMPNFMRPFTTQDNTFQFYLDGSATATVITLPTNICFLSIGGFVTYMNALLVSASVPIVCSQTIDPASTGYSPLTLTFTASTGHTFAPVGYDGTQALEGNFKIGFGLPSYTQALSWTTDGFPNVIQRTNTIRLQTNLTGTTHSANRDFNTTFVVPVGVTPGNMIIFNNPYRIEFPTIIPNIASVTMKMVDDDGIELNIPDNCYMSCQLAIECDA